MSEVRAEETLREDEEDEGIPQRLGIAALAQDAAIYGGTRVLVKSFAFLLVPLYAHFLSPAQFGVLELVLATMALIDVLINLPGALARFYFDRDEPRWRRQVISLYLGIEATYPAVLIGALMVFSGPLSDRIVGTETYAALFLIALVDLYLTNIVDLPLSLARLRRKPLTFAAYAITRTVTQVIFAVLLVAVWHLGIKGILISSLVAACVAFVVTLREYVRDLTTRVNLGVAREMLVFAWPTVVSGLSFYILNLFDRFFVRYYHGSADVGLYGAAFRYSQVVIMGVFAFRMGWSQWHYSWLHTDRHPQMAARGASFYFLAVGFLAAGLSLWILPLFHLLMPERYWDATLAVPPLALSALAGGAVTVFAVGFNVTKKMRLISPIALAGAGAAVGLYFLLVPPYSYLGAAWGTVGALGSVAAVTMAVGNRIYPIPWEWRRIGLALSFTTALAFGALALDEWMPLALSLPVRAGLTIAYPLGLAAVGFFTAEELAALRARIPLLRNR